MIKKIRVGGIMLSGFRPHLEAIVNKIIWYCHKNRHVDQWNRIASPEINPCTYDHLIHDKGGKNIQWTKDSFFNKWCWENWTAKCEKSKIRTFSNIILKNKLKLDYSPKYKTMIKLLEENVGRTLFNLNRISIWGDPYPKGYEQK